MKKLLIAFGTRPEVIKLAPVIKAVKEDFELIVIHTGQHRELADSMLSLFEIKPDVDLNIMEPGQSLFSLTAKLLPKLESILDEHNPDYVMVQGDTSTSYLTALAAFYKKVPTLHVEAGLRSHDIFHPFPEEMNRKQISQLSDFHFAPTELNKKNLLREGVAEHKVHITGNTVIDALELIKRSSKFLQSKPDLLSEIKQHEQLIILTAHRRENHGESLENIFKAVKSLLIKRSDLKVIFPIHPNPNVLEAFEQSGIKDERFILSEPIDYLPFLHLLDRADLILTDSGGIQEEAAALGKPILVLRDTTERQELIDAGLGELVGTESSRIVSRSLALLDSKTKYKPSTIFGDGTAAEKIRKVLKDQL